MFFYSNNNIKLFLSKFKWVWLQRQVQELWAPLKAKLRRTDLQPLWGSADLGRISANPGCGAARPKGPGSASLPHPSNLSQTPLSISKFLRSGRGCRTQVNNKNNSNNNNNN